MSTTVTIRRAIRSDAKAIAELSRTEIEHGLQQRWNAVQIAWILQRPETNAYTLLCNEQLKGFTIAGFGEAHMHLLLHAVAPSMRRRSLGRQLLQWQIDAAIVAGLAEATLEVRAGNAAAQAFYSCMAFDA